MTNEYKYKNIPLNTAASRELILELHSNTTVSRHQIVTDITKAHIERGGLPPNNNPTKNEKTSYLRCIELQIRHLARVLRGKEAKYKPFLIRT